MYYNGYILKIHRGSFISTDKIKNFIFIFRILIPTSWTEVDATEVESMVFEDGNIR